MHNVQDMPGWWQEGVCVFARILLHDNKCADIAEIAWPKKHYQVESPAKEIGTGLVYSVPVSYPATVSVMRAALAAGFFCYGLNGHERWTIWARVPGHHQETTRNRTQSSTLQAEDETMRDRGNRLGNLTLTKSRRSSTSMLAIYS